MAIGGVVEDTLLRGLRSAPPATVYLPFFQHSEPMAGATFSIAASGSLADVSAEMRRIASARLPSAFPSVRPFSEQVRRTLAQERLLANLTTAFGALALVLALSGLYGLQAYVTARRRREIGVRMALGASRNAILRFVLAETVRLVAAGVLLGLAAAWVAGRWVAALLFGLTASDPATVLAATGLMVVTGLAAGLLPAYRAARVDPTNALRYE